MWQCPFSWLSTSSRYSCSHSLMLLAVTCDLCAVAKSMFRILGRGCGMLVLSRLCLVVD